MQRDGYMANSTEAEGSCTLHMAHRNTWHKIEVEATSLGSHDPQGFHDLNASEALGVPQPSQVGWDEDRSDRVFNINERVFNRILPRIIPKHNKLGAKLGIIIPRIWYGCVEKDVVVWEDSSSPIGFNHLGL